MPTVSMLSTVSQTIDKVNSLWTLMEVITTPSLTGATSIRKTVQPSELSGATREASERPQELDIQLEVLDEWQEKRKKPCYTYIQSSLLRHSIIGFGETFQVKWA